ncbi:MAG: hypothetical protein ACK5MV_10740 [Aminipila sp.]
MKKKLFILLLTVAVGTSMVACGSKNETTPDNGSDIEAGEVIDDETNSDDLISDDESIDGDSTGSNDSTEQKPNDKPASGNNTSKPNTGGNVSKPGTGTIAPPSTGNSNNSGSSATLTGDFQDIITGLYKTAGFSDLKTGFTSVTAENMTYYLGVDNLKIKQGLASEPLMSSVAHSVVLIELESGQDVSKAKTAIKNNVDGRKWVCVGVEPEDILVDNIGNFILLVMDENSSSIMDAFKALAK